MMGGTMEGNIEQRPELKRNHVYLEMQCANYRWVN